MYISSAEFGDGDKIGEELYYTCTTTTTDSLKF